MSSLKAQTRWTCSGNRSALPIEHPTAGTIGVALQAVVGRKVRLILAVGLEKRICNDLCALAEKVNVSGAEGYRLLPVPGQVFTEIEAIKLLTGATAELMASEGVCGAEASCWFAVSGTEAQEDAAEKLLTQLPQNPHLVSDYLRAGKLFARKNQNRDD